MPVDHYESSNKSVKDEDFAEDVPKIDGSPEHETDEDGKNWMTNSAPMMEVKKTVLFTFFKAPKRHVNNAADKQENFSKNEETLIFYPHQKSCWCVVSIFYGNFLEMGHLGWI